MPSLEPTRNMECICHNDGTFGEEMAGRIKHFLWRSANCCMLGGLLTWPLERQWVRVESLPMPLAGLGSEFHGVRLAQLSDLHCGMLVREKHLHRYVELVNELDVDFAIVTGDLITTGSKPRARAVARVLGELRVKEGVLACLGNHDYGQWHPSGWGATDGIADFLADRLAGAGITVLRNGVRAFFRGEAVLQFAGVEDFWSATYDPQAAMELIDRDSPVIALAHNPDAAPQLAAMGASWILSGHTHGRPTPDTRFWNAVYPTRQRQFVAGHYSLGPNRHLYVNRGIGNAWRVRAEHRPEITIFTLCPAAHAARRPRLPALEGVPKAHVGHAATLCSGRRMADI